MNCSFPFKKIKANLIFGFALFFYASSSFSQDYFQQETNYTIDVILDDVHHQLVANARLNYKNNSPDTLHFIYFHLYPNAYSDNQTALARQLRREQGRLKLFSDSANVGNIQVEGFFVSQYSLKWALDEKHTDIAKVYLPYGLAPGNEITISIPFTVKIPAAGISRMGHKGQSYQISQWYPKPAVYDSQGWHPMPYLDQGEFYAEFGNYIVNITLPSNYKVGATGNLLSKNESDYLNTLASDTSWKKESDLSVPQIPESDAQLKTIKYSASTIHDFAWFADKRYHVMMDSIDLVPSGKKVYLISLFTSRQSGLWKHSIEYIRSAMLFFSTHLGDYPYEHFTLVQGELGAGSGMEYPGAAVIGFVNDDYTLQQVTVHELLHSWFYGALATNERQYPYLDESLVSALESHYIASLYPDKKLWDKYILEEKTARFFKLDQLPISLMGELEWLYALNNNLEQPLNLPADAYNEVAYYNMIYNKGANAFNYLRAYLGDTLFFEGLNLYFTQWKNKHPGPDDLEQAFAQVTGKNLDWFFREILTSAKRLDYTIMRFDSGRILLKNTGQINGPVLLSEFKKDSLINTTWIEGFKGSKWITVDSADADRFIIDPYHQMIETNRLSNNLYKKGIFKKRDPLKTQLIATLSRPEERLLIYFPAINYTGINGFMPGIGFQNHFIIPRPFEFLILPFYSFKTSTLTGYTNVNFSILPPKPGKKVEIRAEASRFGAPGKQNYHRLNLGLVYNFIPRLALVKDRYRYFVSLAYVSDLQQIIQEEKANWIPIVSAGMEFIRHSNIHPYNILLAAEGNNFFSKLSVTANYRFSYYGKNRGLDVRLFSGIQLHLDSEKKPLFGLSPSARSGKELYTFGGTFFDRFSNVGDSFFSRQISITEGSIITPINLSVFNPSWMFSITLSSSLPWDIKALNIKPFATILLMPEGINSNKHAPVFLAEAGLKTGLGAFFEIFVPLLVTQNLNDTSPLIKDRIRFTLNLEFLSKIGEVL
ncbi:MAG: M1 family metallopeptidase [Lentimicrobium sp.]|nr:M1 family metallopeptidase [Lentimicrobium sp.]